MASAEQMERITEIINNLDGPMQSPEVNRRRQPRVKFRAHLSVTLLSGTAPAPVEVATRNLSLSGIGFVCRRMFSPGERLAIQLRLPKLQPKLILARVTFGRYVSGGLYEMGAEFVECISDARAAAAHPRIPNHWLLAPGTVKTNNNAPLGAN